MTVHEYLRGKNSRIRLEGVARVRGVIGPLFKGAALDQNHIQSIFSQTLQRLGLLTETRPLPTIYLWGLDTQSAVLYRKYIKKGRRGKRGRGWREGCVAGGRDVVREGGTAEGSGRLLKSVRGTERLGRRGRGGCEGDFFVRAVRRRRRQHPRRPKHAPLDQLMTPCLPVID